MVQVEKYLCSKCEALSSKLSIIKKENKQTKPHEILNQTARNTMGMFWPIKCGLGQQLIPIVLAVQEEEIRRVVV
jgi:hypothetical protein